MIEQNKVTPEIMHLFVTDKCNHACKLCCNKLYNIEEIPVPTVEELKTVHTVCITGGEPFLAGTYLRFFIRHLRAQYPNIKNLYIYTSCDGLQEYLGMFTLDDIDGISFSPKNVKDWRNLVHIVINFNEELNQLPSNRLYVFKEQQGNFHKVSYHWLISKLKAAVIGRKWDKEFRTPDNEIFRRLPVLLLANKK